MSNDEVLFQRIGKVLPPGTIICREGETGREMYVLQAGKIQISKKIQDQERRRCWPPWGQATSSGK